MGREGTVDGGKIENRSFPVGNGYHPKLTSTFQADGGGGLHQNPDLKNKPVSDNFKNFSEIVLLNFSIRKVAAITTRLKRL